MTLITMQDGKVVFKDDKAGTEQACCCNAGGDTCSGPCHQTAGYTPFTPDVDCPQITDCVCYGTCTKYAHSICGYFYYGNWFFDDDGNALYHIPWEGNPDYHPASIGQWMDDRDACLDALPEEAFDPPDGYDPPDAAGTASKSPVEMDCSECIPDESTEYWTCVTICEGQCGNPLP